VSQPAPAQQCNLNGQEDPSHAKPNSLIRSCREPVSIPGCQTFWVYALTRAFQGSMARPSLPCIPQSRASCARFPPSSTFATGVAGRTMASSASYIVGFVETFFPFPYLTVGIHCQAALINLWRCLLCPSRPRELLSW